MSEQEIDKALVERVQQGDQRAFDLLVKKYQHKVMSLISRYVKQPADVPDVAQETFVKAYRALANFRGDSAFYTWLYRIAVNTAKNYLVAQGRKPPANDVDADEAEYYEGSETLRDSASPESMLLTDEIRDVVMRTIDELPEDLRRAIVRSEERRVGKECRSRWSQYH